MIKVIKSSELDSKELNGRCPMANNKLEGFDFSKVIVEKPWGYEYLAYNGVEAAVWILRIKKEAATSMHCHPNKKTALAVLSGEAMFSTLDDSFRLKKGDGILLDKKTFHSTKAISDDLIVMEVEAPPDKTDLIKLHDVYGRELKGYEQQNEMCFDLNKYQGVYFNENEQGEKIIGKMLISLKDFRDDFCLQDDLRLSQNAIIILLSGELINNKTDDNFNVGDILEMGTLREIDGIKIKNPVRILKIIKNEKAN